MSYCLGMKIQVVSTAEINEVEVELVFEFEYTPAEKGSHGFYGEQIEPDIDESIEFVAAYNKDGEEIQNLFSEDIDRAMDLALQEVERDGE